MTGYPCKQLLEEIATKWVLPFKDNSLSLRIDNSGRSVIYTFDHNSETVLVIITYNIPNKREYFSLSFGSSFIVIKFDLIF